MGVQLEEGETATQFAYEDYYKTLEKCQRYYETGETTVTTVSDGTVIPAGAFKAVQFKRTKRDTPDVFVKVTNTVGPFVDSSDMEIALADSRKFVLQLDVKGTQSGVRKVKVAWIADSEIPLYNNSSIWRDGTRYTTTEICPQETACYTAEICKLYGTIRRSQTRCNTTQSTANNLLSEVTSNSDAFKLFFSEIPSTETDALYSSRLKNMWGGLCYVFYENSVEQWPTSNGDPNNNYWQLPTGPSVDALGRSCDPSGTPASDGSGGGVFDVNQRWSAANKNEATINHSFRGRYGWGLPRREHNEYSSQNFQDTRQFSDYTITNLDFKAKTYDVLHPTNFDPSFGSESTLPYWDWKQRGCSTPCPTDAESFGSCPQCPSAVRIDPLLPESKTYIFHTLQGVNGEQIKVTYDSLVGNLIHLLNYCQTAPVQDMALSGKPVGYSGMPGIELWGRPFIRQPSAYAYGNARLVGAYYRDLSTTQREQIKNWYYDRYKPILEESDYVQPVIYSLYPQWFKSATGSRNNNQPGQPWFSPRFKQTPWDAGAGIESHTLNVIDQLEISKRAGKPVYAAVSPVYWGAGFAIEPGNEYDGWYYTTMCNPTCSSASNRALNGDVIGNCYEDWRCWYRWQDTSDFINSQIKPLKDLDMHGAVFWWTPTTWAQQATNLPATSVRYWSQFSDTNPNITQYDIDQFPVRITGPDGKEINKNQTDTSEADRRSRWYFVLDQYPLEMRQELERMFPNNTWQTNPTLKTWVESFIIPAAQNPPITQPGSPDNRWYVSERQQQFNARHAYRKMFRELFMRLNSYDPVPDPGSGSDPIFGPLVNGLVPGSENPDVRGWYAPALHRFIKYSWSMLQLHYAQAAKTYLETGQILPNWSMVNAVGGEVALRRILVAVADNPLHAIPTYESFIALSDTNA